MSLNRFITDIFVCNIELVYFLFEFDEVLFCFVVFSLNLIGLMDKIANNNNLHGVLLYRAVCAF